MKNSTIILVTQLDLAAALLSDIKLNEKHPDELIIIDNSKDGFNYSLLETGLPQTDIKYKRNNPARPLNESWMWGFNAVSHNMELITVLNDDLILTKQFYTRLDYIMKNLSAEYAVACPHTVKEEHQVAGVSRNMKDILIMDRREGWAFTMRKFFMDYVIAEPIPSELKTFCGDDWIWLHARQRQLKWVKILGNPIYHYGGATIRDNGTRPDLKSEKILYSRLTDGGRHTPNFQIEK